MLAQRRRVWGALLLVLTAAMLGRPHDGAAAARRDRPVRPKVLNLIYNPIIEAEGGKRLHEVCRWKDPAALTAQYVADIKECSGDFAQYQVVDTQVLDQFPKKRDGFRYTDESFLQCFRAGKGWHQPDAIDYHAIVEEFDLVRRVNRREIDEVWVFGMPYSGLYESTMGGRGAYFCNSPPLTGVDSSRIFVIMGFNYERGVGEMLEDIGHRTESILRRVYGSWDPEETHMWNRFTLYEKVAPGRAACGNVHFAPNSKKDYEWGNKTPVWSTADDWLNYPRLTGKARMMTAADWGNGDIRLHHKWWLTRLPKAPGKAPDGKQANWWKYVIDFNRYEESR
ncbi:MAG: uncharacterized protein K0Q72_257 [Armatimonadetes bacterium]|nr:uncharacterized protein [Armatimonadota bacterium]